MGQKKLIRFAELETFPNVLQYPENTPGTWSRFFNNDHPIVLELGCGKGEYTVGLAGLFPDKNFIGVDIKGNRLWVGAKKALRENLRNVAFLRTQIDKIAEYFEADEVSEIWITFPDPQLRVSKSKKRLTHPKFLRLYQNFLKPSGNIHLKTDSPELYQFTKTVIGWYNCALHEDIENIYSGEPLKEELQIKTYYESLDIARSNKVHYLSFSLPYRLPGRETDMKLHKFLKNDVEENQEENAETTNSTKPGNEEDDLYYFNDTGLVIFTEEYLLQRGYCCGSGCTNCPYDYKAVPEPQRTILLVKRKNEKENNR